MGEIILRSTLARVPSRRDGYRRCRACGIPARRDDSHCREGCFFERIFFHGFPVDIIRRGDQLSPIMGGEAMRRALARVPRPGEA